MAKWCNEKSEWVWSNSLERLARSGQEGPQKARKAIVTIFAVTVGAPFLWTGLDMITGFQLAANVEDVFPKPQFAPSPEGAEDCFMTSSGTVLSKGGAGCTDDVLAELQSIQSEHLFANMRYQLKIPYMNSYADIKHIVTGQFLPN